MSSASTTPSSLKEIPACAEFVEGVLEKGRKVYVLHHWDADGVASAAILTRLLGSRIVGISTPRIGVYGASALNPDEIRGSGADTLVVLDYGARPDEVLARAPHGVQALIVDHHAVELSRNARGRCCNPVALGMSEAECPSTTWVLYELLNSPSDIVDLVALGIVGDLGPALATSEYVTFVDDVAAELGLTLNDFVRAVELIDSCYRIVNGECIEHAVQVLAEEGVKGVLHDEVLINARESASRYVESAYDRLQSLKEPCPGVRVWRLSLDSLVTSYVGRSLARAYPDDVILLAHSIPSLNVTYVYVRSYSVPLRRFLEKLRKEGLNVGGKDMVFVVTCSEGEDCDEVLSKVTTHLCRDLSEEGR